MTAPSRNPSLPGFSCAVDTPARRKPAAEPPGTFDYRTIMRAFTQHVAEDRPLLQTPAKVAELMLPILSGKKQEEFWIVLLDTKHRALKCVCVTVGLLDRSQIHGRSVFRPAIEHSACRLILAHGHPSGDPTPSAQDIACTRNLVAAGKIVGIEVLDHIVIGERTAQRPKFWVSFREENLL